MGKNIVICCDGTSNQLGNHNSNVVKLYAILDKKAKDQIAFYDPGVGTMSEPGIRSPWSKKINIALGLAFGKGLSTNVMEAYTYLMNNYEDGDKIYLFGFSRGAYTVRVLAAFIDVIGLLPKGCDNLLLYAFQTFEAACNSKEELAQAIKFKRFYARAQRVKIHFLGVWDTVSSYGFIGSWKKFQGEEGNKSILCARHALAIDERRTLFSPSLLQSGTGNCKDLKQVWFVGEHSDVGGSWEEEESGLSKISLNWILVEAFQKGLKLDKFNYYKIALGEKTRDYAKPDPCSKLHNSLTLPWWFLEFFPRVMWNENLTKRRLVFPFGSRRKIYGNQLFLHKSVEERMNEMGYCPDNLPDPQLYQFEEIKYLTEEDFKARKEEENAAYEIAS